MKRLADLAAVAQRFAMSQRTNPVQIETYPHVAGDGFEDGETCFEVTVRLGGEIADGLGRTLEEAVTKCSEAAARILRRQVESARKESTYHSERATWLAVTAAELLEETT